MILGRTGLTLAALVAGSAFAVVSTPVAAKSSSRRSCDAHRHGAALVTREVVVYGRGTGTDQSTGNPTTTYFACSRPGGLGVELGVDEQNAGEYGSDATTGGFVAAGTFVAADSSSGEAAFAECSKYGDSRGCPPPSYWISVADTRTRRHVDVVGVNSPVVLSPQGALAWLVGDPSSYELWATALDPRGRSSLAAAPSIIDTGAIDSRSLRFGGRTLHWVRGGQAHQQTLAAVSPAAPPAAFSWSAPTLIGRPPASVAVAGMSCASVSLCVYVDNQGFVSSTNPTGGSSAWLRAHVDGANALSGVSCVAVSLCVAVDSAGNVLSSTDPTGGASAWHVAHVDGTNALTGVSCASVSLCVAVDKQGAVVTSTNPTGGASAWQVTHVDGTTSLTGVSCQSVSLCVAVDSAGNLLSSTNPTGSGGWLRVHVDGTNALSGVSCASVSLCVAVDSGGNVLSSTNSTGGTSAWQVAHVDGTTSLRWRFLLVGVAVRRSRLRRGCGHVEQPDRWRLRVDSRPGGLHCHE